MPATPGLSPVLLMLLRWRLGAPDTGEEATP
jgi:hypothetical protein